MKLIARLAYWGLLGLPSLAFLVISALELSGACRANPYDDFTCPAAVAYLLPVATLGFLTLIPFLVIGAIWVAFGIAIGRHTDK